MRQATVLLVDRNSDSVNIYSMMLRHHGFAVLLANGPDEALKMVVESKPDVIISALPRPARGREDLIEVLHRNGTIVVPPLIQLDTVRHRGATPAGWLVTRLLMPCEPSRLLKEVQRLLARPAGVQH